MITRFTIHTIRRLGGGRSARIRRASDIDGSSTARTRAEAAESEDSTRSERIRPHQRDQRRHQQVRLQPARHQRRPRARRTARRRRHRHQAIFCLLTERLRARRRRLHRRRPDRRAWLRRRLWVLGERRPRLRRRFTAGRVRAITIRATF